MVVESAVAIEVVADVAFADVLRVDGYGYEIHDVEPEHDDAVAGGADTGQGVEEDSRIGELTAMEVVGGAFTDGVVEMHKGVATGLLGEGGMKEEE